MKRILVALFVASLQSPASAITWKEFWEPFTYENPSYYRRYTPMCSQRVIHEEYIPGNRWRSGYVRRWSEWVNVPCYDDY